MTYEEWKRELGATMLKAAQTKSIRIDAALHEAVRAASYHGRVTVTAIAEQAVMEWLERRAPTMDRLLRADKAMASILRSDGKPTRHPEPA